MRPLERIQEDLDELADKAESKIEYIKAKAARRPWVFIASALAIGFVMGSVLAQ